jgi:hypothetical protein
LAKEEPKAGDLGVSARSAGVPPAPQPELAEAEASKLKPAATPTPIGTSASSFAGVEQTTPMKGSISGKLPAIENSDALAQNRSFNRLTVQTNAGQLSVAASQNFVQAGVFGLQNYFKNSVASAQATPVLQSFQLQQNGNTISVVDGDGSVYSGSVRPETITVRNEPASADTFAKPGALPQAQGKAGQAAENQQQAVQNYFFRVSGMNRTLKQNVVFTGNVLANNAMLKMAQTSNFPGAFGGGGGGGAGGQIQQAAANPSQQNLLSNSRIVGTAVIDRTNQIEINAVPVAQ